MDFRVEELAPCRKRVTVTVPVESVREALDAQYREINKQLVLPGFRPGKAPRKLLESRFATHVREEVRSKLVEAAVKQAVEEKKVAPLGAPTLDVGDVALDPDKPFEFAFEVTTRPDFDLPEWKGIEVKVPAATVTDADVDLGVERLLLGEGTLETSPDPLAADDVAVLDWKATAGGDLLHSEDGSYYRMGRSVLDGVVVEGLDKAILGARAGVAAILKGRAAPDDIRPSLAGKEFDVALEIKEAKRFRPADLDEAFLRRHDFDDVEEFRKDVRRRILRARERERERVAEDRLVDALVAKSAISLPADVVENAVTGWMERRRIEAQSEGVSDDDVAKELAASRQDVTGRVEADLRRHFVLEKIAEAEDLTVSEQELLGAVEQMARDSGRSTGELVQHFQEDPGRLAEMRSHLRHGKAREALRRSASVVEAAAPAANPAPAATTAPKKGK
jgi:trigger factor